MKFRILASIAIGLIASSASARVIDKEFGGRCEILSVIKSTAPVGSFVTTDVIPFQLPAAESVTINTVTGPQTYRFGTGKFQIEKSVRMLDASKAEVVKPIKLTLEVVLSSPTQKTLLYSFTVFNPFTGQNEVLENSATPYTRWAPDSFMYVDPVITHPAAASAKVGDLIQSGVRCFFFD